MGSQYARSVRKVEGLTYEDTLNDIATRNYYDWMLPFDEKPELRGHKIWHSERELEGWEWMILAIVSQSAKEYVRWIISERENKRASQWTAKYRQDEGDFLEYWVPEIKEEIDRQTRYMDHWELHRFFDRMKVYW